MVKIKGYKAAAGATRGLRVYGKFYVQIQLNAATGEVYHHTHLRGNYSYPEYTDEPILHIMNCERPTSMKKIRDECEYTLRRYERLDAEIQREIVKHRSYII